MQNKIKQPKKTISLPNLLSIIIAVVLIVGIGMVYGLLGYLFSGIKENVTPAIQKPSLEITDNYFGNEYIQIKSPQKNATIKNPVLISGKANVNEANVRIRISDDNKNILADDFITADGWLDKLYFFEKEINYKMPETKNGLIEVFEESMKDGSDLYKVEMPVIFEDFKDAFSDWKVYQNEEFGFEVKYPKELTLFQYKPKAISKHTILHEDKFSNEDYSISIRISPKRENKNYEVIKETSRYKKINFNNYQAIRDIGVGVYYFDTIRIYHDKYYYELMYTNYFVQGTSSEDKNKRKFSSLTNEEKINIEKYELIFNQILSTFKFIEKDETADENKPSIYLSKGGGGLLSLNGEKTGFPAYEFEKEEFILFTNKEFGDYETKGRSLKTASTKYPFEEKTLSEEIGGLFIEGLFEEKGLYFLGEFADGPGSGIVVFMFDPENKEFIYFSRKAMFDIKMNIISSKSSVVFNAEKKSRILLGESEDSLSDDDIEIIINNEKLSKKDVDDGHLIENQEAIFNCRPPYFFIMPEDYYDHPDRYPDNYGRRINDGKINIRRYIEYFPDKFPCFVDGESDEITGYFDLIENKFVSVSNL